MDRLTTPLRILRLALGLTALLAGLDKFVNILADWGRYVSPLALQYLPFPIGRFMAAVGLVEVAVGIAILFAAPRAGAYVASAWLALVAANLVLGGHYDIAVRDVVISIAAFTLARGIECEAPQATGVRRAVAASLAGAMLFVAAPASAQTHDHAGQMSKSAAFHQAMRKLWSDHVIWTRDYIVAAVYYRPDVPAAAGRLMKNQEDIGAAVGSVYGKAAGDQLTSLLKEHISIAVDLIKFARAGDKASQTQADTKWHRNGEAIADFLSKANPNWPRATLVDMMNAHLATTTDEVVARLTKNWDADVRAFDKVYAHILAMSDALADGIVKQFPEKFRG
jgi:uncharacterized membrane protein YphA (DoxX/SURF4 family)